MTTQLQRRILVLRSAFLQYLNAKGHCEQEFANIAEAMQDAGRGGELATDSVTRLLGLMRDEDSHTDAVSDLINRLYQEVAG